MFLKKENNLETSKFFHSQKCFIKHNLIKFVLFELFVFSSRNVFFRKRKKEKDKKELINDYKHL